MCSVVRGQMSSVETGQMSVLETRQMSAVDTRQMSSAGTRRMSTGKTGRCPVSSFYICLVSAEDIWGQLWVDFRPMFGRLQGGWWRTLDQLEDTLPVKPRHFTGGDGILFGNLSCIWRSRLPMIHFKFLRSILHGTMRRSSAHGPRM